MSLFEQLQPIFLKHDPAKIDPLANNLLDEYNAEIDALLTIYNEEGAFSEICELAELLDEIFNDFFYPLEIDIEEAFVNDVANVLGVQ